MTTADSEDTVPIADKVRFWEEQDKINQELIPRVIRQHELITSHIADHENLPLIAANAISEALTEALQQQQERYESALAEVKAESEEQRRQHQTELEAAKTEREAQTRQHADEAATGLGGKRCPGSRGRRSTGWCGKCCPGNGSGQPSCCGGLRIRRTVTNGPNAPMPSAAPPCGHHPTSLPELTL